MIKDIIIDKNFIKIEELPLNINIVDDNNGNSYEIKISTTETLAKLREKLKIKNIYKFLSKNKNFVLLFQENLYKIKDILTKNYEVHLKVDYSLNNHFSDEELKLVKDYYFLKLNNKIYKMILNHEDYLYEVRDKIEINEDENYCFLNTKGKIIAKDDEDKITIGEIKLEKTGKYYVNLVNINEPIEFSKFVNIENGLKIYIYPKINLNYSQINTCKKLIFIGETGCGKTTLINSFINYLMGINKYDNFRYIIDENNKKKNVSQTTNINSYYVLPSNKKIPPIELIDSPGFGDTREFLDEGVLDRFKHFFEFQNKIDLICFVMDSTITRNTSFNEYIMSNIFGLFGKDIISNFVLLFTFCDGGPPLCLNNLKSKDNIFNRIINKIPEPSYILFNNSSIFSGEIKYRDLFWEICYDGFSKLISKLLKTDRNDLQLTRKVIKLRNEIKIKSESLNKYLDYCSELRDILDNNLKKFNELYIEMENNKDYISIIKKEKKEKIDTAIGIHNINCLICKKTCHKLCEEIKEGNILTCKIMKKFACEICKCSFKKHCDLPYYFEEKIEEKERINIKKYKNLDNAQINLAKIDNIIHLKIEELNQNINSSNDCVIQIQNDFENLNKISLFSNIYGIQENFVDYKISLENFTKENGYSKKIEIYQKYKKIFSRLSVIYTKNNIFKDLEIFNKDLTYSRYIVLEKVKTILNFSEN